MHEQILMSPSNLSKTRRWVCLFAVLFGEFVVAIDMTVLNIALPSLTAELRPTSDQQLWIVDAYSLVLAGLLVASSSLSDRWGRKRMLLSGFAVFGIASAFILVAQTPEAIIAIRAILGVGGAMIIACHHLHGQEPSLPMRKNARSRLPLGRPFPASAWRQAL